jgi:hypothetical protein
LRPPRKLGRGGGQLWWERFEEQAWMQFLI